MRSTGGLWRLKISSSMISWNEASTIDLALKSLKGFAQEVVIVDTGSFDGTVSRARRWIKRLGLRGIVKQVKIKNLGDARLQSFKLCRGDWVLMQDSNLVLSNALKKELLAHARNHPRVCGDVKSLNLMGDYSHYFRNCPFMAPHRIFVERAQAKWKLRVDRPHFWGKARVIKNWAVNLSRVRPAWRYWLRGEQFDRRYYTKKNKRWLNPANIQRLWEGSRKAHNRYHSPLEYIEAERGLTLEDVKRTAPEWFLKQLQLEAAPLTPKMRADLPEVIKKELKKPRYKLRYRKGKIVGRWPEL